MMNDENILGEASSRVSSYGDVFGELTSEQLAGLKVYAKLHDMTIPMVVKKSVDLLIEKESGFFEAAKPLLGLVSDTGDEPYITTDERSAPFTGSLPVVPKEGQDVGYRVYVGRDDMTRLRLYAQFNGMSVSGVIRALVRLFIQENSGFFDVVEPVVSLILDRDENKV